jgi:hypothetical protein
VTDEERIRQLADEVDGFHIVDCLKDRIKGMIATAYRLGIDRGRDGE